LRIFRDLLNGLDHCLDHGPKGLALALAGLAAGWWLYVPIHEMLHAAGCLAAGGSVTRLEIAPLYGGALLQRIFPFVVAGGDYAGRLSGFATNGSDLVYLATDLGPFVLTLFPGVWWLRKSGRAGRPVLFGLSLPFALAPFLSLPGDAYEIGSILVTRLPPWAEMREILRGDDLFQQVERLAALPDAPWGGLVLAALVGLSWALLTCAAGGAIARALGEGPVPPRTALSTVS
jgi:hypothetical protein